MLLGAAVSLSHPNDVTSLLLAAVLHLATSPIGPNLLARATYFTVGIPTGMDTFDQLGQG